MPWPTSETSTKRISANHHLCTELFIVSGECDSSLTITTTCLFYYRAVAKQITQEKRDRYWRRSEIYRHWLLDNIFKANGENSVTIMILPIEKGEPNYRDVDPPYVLCSHYTRITLLTKIIRLHHILHGFDPLNMSPMMRAPELTAIGDYFFPRPSEFYLQVVPSW